MFDARSYHDPCGIARALDVVGERWALLVVRELLFGPKRFTDLHRGLPGMSQNVLAQRLRELEQAGIVERCKLGPPASTRAYGLTPRGADLEPVLLALGRWGSRGPHNATAELSVAAFVLALKTTFSADLAAGLHARVELNFGEDRFAAVIKDGQFHVARGVLDEPDASVAADVATLRAIVFGGRPLAEAVDARALVLRDDRAIVARFVACFPRPRPIPAGNGRESEQ
ncbi:MAG TPA: winged helix-turn-helix transcriptional regulator [Chloroflexota bacterium]|nr:winged helix-turn-helix transcriptional regulator [Chloroflexota bacterium]